MYFAKLSSDEQPLIFDLDTFVIFPALVKKCNISRLVDLNE